MFCRLKSVIILWHLFFFPHEKCRGYENYKEEETYEGPNLPSPSVSIVFVLLIAVEEAKALLNHSKLSLFRTIHFLKAYDPVPPFLALQTASVVQFTAIFEGRLRVYTIPTCIWRGVGQIFSVVLVQAELCFQSCGSYQEGKNCYLGIFHFFWTFFEYFFLGSGGWGYLL